MEEKSKFGADTIVGILVLVALLVIIVMKTSEIKSENQKPRTEVSGGH